MDGRMPHLLMVSGLLPVRQNGAYGWLNGSGAAWGLNQAEIDADVMDVDGVAPQVVALNAEEAANVAVCLNSADGGSEWNQGKLGR